MIYTGLGTVGLAAFQFIESLESASGHIRIPNARPPTEKQRTDSEAERALHRMVAKILRATHNAISVMILFYPTDFAPTTILARTIIPIILPAILPTTFDYLTFTLLKVAAIATIISSFSLPLSIATGVLFGCANILYLFWVCK